MAYFKYQGKTVFYEVYGQGEPLVFLHGNTASSKMFEFLMPLYTDDFRCILIDFLGNGRSDRLEKFFGKSFIRKKECQNECTVETVL